MCVLQLETDKGQATWIRVRIPFIDPVLRANKQLQQYKTVGFVTVFFACYWGFVWEETRINFTAHHTTGHCQTRITVCLRCSLANFISLHLQCCSWQRRQRHSWRLILLGIITEQLAMQKPTFHQQNLSRRRGNHMQFVSAASKWKDTSLLTAFQQGHIGADDASPELRYHVTR